MSRGAGSCALPPPLSKQYATHATLAAPTAVAASARDAMPLTSGKPVGHSFCPRWRGLKQKVDGGTACLRLKAPASRMPSSIKISSNAFEYYVPYVHAIAMYLYDIEVRMMYNRV